MRLHRSLLSAVCLLICALSMSGCSAIAVFANAVPKSEDAKYKGLAKQRVAVMIWADRATRVDFQTLQLDLGNTIQSILLSKAGEDDVKDIQFPYEVRSVIRFQKEHPELEGRDATESAQRMSGITRMIYVEIGDFTTRSDTAVQLMRGSIMTNVKVVEISGGKATIAYQANNLQNYFPPKQKEGVIDVPEQTIYAGTVQAMGQQVAELFYGHIIED